MSTNDKIEDALTRHHIFVQRYAKGREKEAAQFIRGLIKRSASYLDEGGTVWSDNRLKKTLVDLTGYINAMGDKYNENVITEMTKFAEQEADFNYQVLDTNVNVSTSLPAPNQIQAAILTKPLEIEATTGYTMRQALASFTTAKAAQITQLITDGYVLGETTEQIIQRILGIEGTQRRQAETLARTITNHMSSAARELTMRENEDVLDGWKWVATLDTRTTLICGTRDGKVYPLDGEVKFPPAHFNCRSTAVFNVKDEYDLGKDIEGQRPSKGADGTKQIGANTSYEEWLRKQPPEFQDEILGKEKADLFRKGNVPFDRFVDERGNPVSLGRLKELDEQFNGMPVSKAVPPVETMPPPQAFKPFTMRDKFVATSAPYEKYEQTINERTSLRTLMAIQKSMVPVIQDSGTGRERGAWYSFPQGGTINYKFGDSSELSLVHEYGHHIDFVIGRRGGLDSSKGTWWSAYDEGFVNAFAEDRKALNLDKVRQRQDILRELADRELYVETTRTITIGGNERVLIDKKLKNPYFTQIMDIFDAMTEGVARERLGFAGHGKKYYKSRENRYVETFAQLFSLEGSYDSEVQELVQKYFPNLLKRYNEIIDEYIEKGIDTYNG